MMVIDVIRHLFGDFLVCIYLPDTSLLIRAGDVSSSPWAAIRTALDRGEDTHDGSLPFSFSLCLRPGWRRICIGFLR